MKKIACFTLFVCFIVTSCHKNTKVNHYKIDQGVKDYFNWQAGTYWIFTDTLTGKKDSFAVAGSTDLDHFEGDYYDELLTIGILEFYNPDSAYRGWVIEIHSSKDANRTDISSPYQQNAYYNFIVGFPFSLNSNDPDVVKSILPSVIVNGKSYSNVYQYYITLNNDEILMNADSGFIKMRFSQYSHQVLELDHCHIAH